MKRIVLSLFIVIAVVLVGGTNAFADSGGKCGDNAYWQLDDYGNLTILGSGRLYDSPWKYETRKDFRTVVIQGGITSIGNHSFSQCEELISVTMPDSLASIGENAFSYCSGLTSITIPKNVTSIGNNAFQACSGLTSLTIPDRVSSIGWYAFADCTGLSRIIIPGRVTSIQQGAFVGCKKLKTAGPIGGNYNYQFGWTNKIPKWAFDNCESLNSVVIPDGIVSIGDAAFYGCSGLSSISLPDSITSIGKSVFGKCTSLIDITLSKNTTSIPNYAFEGCINLKSVPIPNSVLSIGDYAFHSCSGLNSIAIPESVIAIGKQAFFRCTSLTNVIIPSSVMSIGLEAFYDCKGLLTAGPIGGGDYNIQYGWSKSFPEAAFHTCTSLISITMSNTVTAIGKTAFQSCISLRDVYFIGSSEQWETITIGQGNNSLVNATIHFVLPDLILPSALTTVEAEAFTGGAFTYVKLPENIAVISAYAFSDCQNLTYIYIPEVEMDINSLVAGDMKKLIALGKAGGYAKSYARECNFFFIAIV